MAIGKTELRREALANRVPRGESQGHSVTITRYLIGSQDWKNAETILAYRPLPGETGTELIVEHATADGKTVYYPRVEGEALFFHSPSQSGQYRRGGLGVEEPDPSWPIWSPTHAERVLVLVPALGFDARGYRLGRGAGYYDRFTAKMREDLKSRVRFGGLCFSRNLLEDLPEDPWDQPMDWVLTENGFVSH